MDRRTQLVLELVDGVSRPAKRIKAELASLNGLSRTIGSMPPRMAAMSRQYERMGAAVSNYAQNASAADKSARTAVGGRMLMPMPGVGMLAPLGGAYAGKQVISQAADFESMMTAIEKKAGTTTEQTRALGEEIKELATSGEVASSIADIAAAYERGAAAGIPIDELREFAIVSAKGADAFEMQSEAVGNFSARLRTALGMSSRQVREVFDLTNALADAGIADESAIVDFMSRSGATLKTLGLQKEESLALGASLLNIGMQSEQASTGIGALASKLLTVSELTGDKRKTFEKYLGNVEDFADLVEEDANDALLEMLDTLKELDKTDRMAFLTSFVGREWSDEMLRLVEATDEYRRNLELAGDRTRWFGSLDKSYRLKLDDFWSQWELLKNEISKLVIDFGTSGMPELKAALQNIRSLIGEIGRGMQSFKATVDTSELDEAISAVGDLASAISGLMNMGGEGSGIQRFFTGLAEDVNSITNAVNRAEDVLQSLGLVKPDGDSAKTQDRRRERFQRDMFGDALVDRYERAKRSRDTDPGIQDRRESLDKFLSGPRRPVPEAAPSRQFDAGRFGSDVNAVTGNLAKALEDYSRRVMETGEAVKSMSVRVKPFIDTSSIDGAQGKVDRLRSTILNLPGATVESTVPASPPIAGARARGGPVRRGLTYLVGENGEELFTPDRDGRIITNHELRGAAAGGVGGGIFGGGKIELHAVVNNNFSLSLSSTDIGRHAKAAAEQVVNNMFMALDEKLNRSPPISFGGLKPWGDV